MFALADEEGRTLISADTDFGTLLSQRGSATPSVVLFRRLEGRRPGDQADLLLTVLDRVADALEAGAIVVIESDRVRVRRLPIG